MGTKIAVWAIRIAGLIALVMGLIYWLIPGVISSRAMDFHQLLGIIVTISLWVLGYFLLTAKGGKPGLAIGAIVIGLLLVSIGLAQRPLFAQLDIAFHLPIRLIHAALGIMAIGIGEAVGARLKRLTAAQA